jgi:hypothetical protein
MGVDVFSKEEIKMLIEDFRQPLRLKALREKSQMVMGKTGYKIASNFLTALQDEQIIRPHIFTSKNNKRVTLYSSQALVELSLYETATAMFPAGYFCNLSAIYCQSLTNQVPKTVYICTESNARKTRANDALTDSKLRQAFLKPHRYTSFIFNFPAGDLVMIERMRQTDSGVVSISSSAGLLPYNSRVSCVERALIDAVVSPQYNGGIASVADYFAHARGRIDMIKLIDIYRELDFIYPYYQAIGFFLERTGMSDLAGIFRAAFAPKNRFYLDHNAKSSWKYDERWMIYYPEGVVDEY